ncbi:universal stress protein [Pseudomonas mangiferae]|uniref:Universal stress protein n=1 Tax=Pseudomonas mangiferae TaxID=2593654 RepID=A0A553GZ27_9PSED|nr:universal stress protein [Pseudomonas mangiferae]TRX74733.1 universal stress protein [Pseudomonas mangiferae]
MFKHILIAHDLSLEADRALRRALHLADQHRARLTLLHVLPEAAPLGALREDVEAELRQRLDAGDAQAPEPRIRVVAGRPAEAILACLAEDGCDLLVLGAHHRAPARFAGSNLERLARDCPVPLLLATGDEPGPYGRALVALDASRCARLALELTYLLLPADAELRALHVFEEDAGAAPDPADAYWQARGALMERRFSEERAGLPDNGPRLGLDVRRGCLPETLLEAIAQRRTALLALGHHARGPYAQPHPGQLAQRMLQAPPCDLLLVR